MNLLSILASLSIANCLSENFVKTLFMTQAINSIRSTSYFLCFISIFIISGCAKNTTQHILTKESSPITKQDPKLKQNKPTKITKKPTDPNYTVWDRMISLYAFPEINNDRIEREIQQYLKKPNFLVTIQQRAEPFLYFILNELEAKQLPGELALLPAVESSFRVNAISKSHAAGLWQFIPSTGRLFGLKQSWWYDGRKDIYSSTQAATKYLYQLNDLYEDWPLALAAYNAGKGTIRKAIRHNKRKNLDTDYWSLSLTKETQDYVPRLLALAKIFANSEKYNLTLLLTPNKPHFSVVEIGSQLNLTTASALAGMSHNDFMMLNPAYERSTADPDGPFHLLIHTNKVQQFEQKLALLPKSERIKWIRHKIMSGESLSSIAHKYRSSVIALRKNNKLNNNNIRAGQYLKIPASMAQSVIEVAKLAPNDQLYIVKKGDTISEIARIFSVSISDIALWNNFSPNFIHSTRSKINY